MEPVGTEPTAEGELTAASALQRWRELADRRAAAEAAYEEKIASFKNELDEATAPLDTELATIEQWFLDHAEQVGQDAFADDGGTVSITARENPKIADPDAFFAWAESTNNSSLLQKRISVTEFRKFQSANADEVPPGVQIETTRSAKFKPAG